MDCFLRVVDAELHQQRRPDLQVLQRDCYLVAVDEEWRHQLQGRHLEELVLMGRVEQLEGVASLKQVL